MPELPEVETTRRGIAMPLVDQRVTEVVVRHRQLRWKVPDNLAETLKNKTLLGIDRRSKYLLLNFGDGTLIMHLGMSGSLRVLPKDTPAQKHDHIDIIFNNTLCLRLRDPRRFGAVLWAPPPIDEHFLLKELGPEPLSGAFNAEYLHRLTRNKKSNIKTVIMNAHYVVGVGNIYASESLFYAGIKPTRIASKLSVAEARKLVTSIQNVLEKSILAGGTTLQDFSQADGKPGYFAQQLAVYGRAGKPCRACNSPIHSRIIGGRNTYFCSKCQK